MPAAKNRYWEDHRGIETADYEDVLWKLGVSLRCLNRHNLRGHMLLEKIVLAPEAEPIAEVVGSDNARWDR